MTRTIKMLPAILTIALISSAHPAFASDKAIQVANVVATDTYQSGAGSQPQAADTKASPKKYCLSMEPLSGSRVSTTKCRTKAEWEQQGIEISDKK